MSYIILAHLGMTEVLEQAAKHLQLRGHHVDITNDVIQVFSLVTKRYPDVLIASSPLRNGQGFTLVSSLKENFPNLKTQFIWIAPPDNITGEPVTSWGDINISNILPPCPSDWQIVLAVEQTLYREIMISVERQALAHLQFLTTRLTWHLNNKQGRFPMMSDFHTVVTALEAEYKHLRRLVAHPDPARQFCPNSTLSHVVWKHLADTTDLVLFYEDPPQSDGTRWVAFLEGVPGHFHPRLERVSAVDWQGLRPEVSPKP